MVTRMHSAFLGLLMLAVCCHGDGTEMASHLLLLDALPDGISPDVPTPLVVRSNFSGRVVLEEGEDIRVLVNVTSSSLPRALAVQAHLHHARGALVLQLHDQPVASSPVSLRWVLLGCCLAASLALLLALVYGVCVFRREASHYDFSERKSCTSGSQHGLYRSRNSVQLVPFPPDPPLGEEADVHNDDTLKRVPEMPEEEAAEAIEMEELKNQRNHEALLQQQEGGEDKNVAASRLHSQGKKLHKELLRPKRQPRRKRTANGLYTGVAGEPGSSPENSQESDTEAGQEPGVLEGALTRSEGELDRAGTAPGKRVDLPLPVSLSLQPGELKQGQEDSRPHLSRAEGVQHLEAATSPQATPNLYSPFLVQADVHPQGRPELVALTPGQSRPTTSSPRLTTFSPPPRDSPTALASFRPTVRKVKVAFSDEDPRGRQDDGGYERISSLPRAATRAAAQGAYAGLGPPAHEDDGESGHSEGEMSHSLFGSSEIFGGNLGDGRYLSLADSDLAIPNLDSDDASLPGSTLGRDSHLPPTLSPFPTPLTPGRMAKPSGGRPQVPAKPQGISSTPKASAAAPDSGDDSPPLPPPPEEFLTQAEAREGFSFPPPPKMFAPGQGQTQGQGQGAEYVNLQSRRPGDPRPGSGRGGRKPPGPKTLNMTLLTLTCVLAVVTGVWSKMAARETTVHVTIYAPRHFLSNSTTVFFRVGGDTEVDDYIGVPNLNVYDVREPILEDAEIQGEYSRGSRLCDVMGCPQGCDVKTGECICLRGYRLTDDGECADVNECMTGRARCHKDAGCLNRHGSYDCVCDGLFYGDGKFCKECSAPCDAGEYERQPCLDGNQKICLPCTTHCPEGSFMLRSCELRSNAVCRDCSLKCKDNQFEVKACTSGQNRECQDRQTLPEPEASDNVMLEDLAKVRDETLEIPYLRPSEFIGVRRFKFVRGSGLTVDVRISHLEPLQLFVPVNATPPSSRPQPPSQFSQEVHERYCPHPVPNYYILHYTKHQNVTYTRAGHLVEPCETWQRWGSFPDNRGQGQRSDQGFLCAEPGPMTELFDIPSGFFWTASHWVERSKRCGNYSSRCQECCRTCAWSMKQGPGECDVAADDSDNGWSPRLHLCLNCCLRQNCSDACRNFHRRHCQPKMCEVGHVVEFKVQPKWDSSSRTRFFCHLTPLKRQWILELEYSVSHHSKFLHSNHVSMHGDDGWEQHGRMNFKDAILELWVDSKLPQLPDFLEGEVDQGREMLHVGRYRNTGSTVQSTVIGGESIFIRPSKPFSLESNINGRNHCDSSILQSALLAKKEEAPYVVDNDLMTLTYYDRKFPYIVTHEHAPPMLKIRLGAEVSVFGGIYPMGTLAAGSLQGDIRQNSTHWTLTLTGELLDFPNRLIRVEVLDPGYPTKPLYRVEAVVGRPPNFRLTFALPSRDEPGVERRVLARVTDAAAVYSLLLYRPSSTEQLRLHPLPLVLHEGEQGGGTGGETGGTGWGSGQPVVFSSWYVWAVCGGVVLLLCLAVVGLALAPGVPGPEAQNVRCHHVALMAGYVVFHLVYSLVLSFSAFALVVLALNWDRGVLLGQLGRLGQARHAAHQVELADMAGHLGREMARQQQLHNASLTRCHADMAALIADIGKLQEEAMSRTEDVFEKQDIKNVFQRHALEVVRKLSADLSTFRKELDKYIRGLLARLSRDVRLTVASVEGNSWTAGARFLHGSVQNIRKNLNSMATLPFLQWAKLAPDMNKLVVAPDLALPPIPDFFSDPLVQGDTTPRPDPVPGTSKRATPHSSPHNPDFPRDVRVYNHWVYPLQPPPPSASKRPQSEGSVQAGEGGTRGVTWGVTLWVVLGALVLVDVILFLHRMLSAISMGQLLLYGYPEYLDYRERSKEETANEEDDDVFGNAPQPQEVQGGQEGQAGEAGQMVGQGVQVMGRDKERTCARDCWYLIKYILWQVMSTLFIPKAVATVVVTLLLYYTLTASSQLLTSPALRRLGLLPDMDGFLDLQVTLTNARLTLHTQHVNDVLYPAYQSWMTSQLERHQFAFRQQQQQMHILQQVHNQTYCRHLELLGLAGNCSHGNQETPSSSTLSTPGCQFTPLTARLYQRSNFRERRLVEEQLASWLAELRALVGSCCQVVAAFLSLAVLKELVGATLWIYVRRSGAVRLRFIYETDEDQTFRTAE